MKKTITIILVLSLCISFCSYASDYYIEWFGMKNGYDVFDCNDKVVILKNDDGFAMCDHNGKLIIDYDYLFGIYIINDNLYQGVKYKGDKSETEYFDEKGKIISSDIIFSEISTFDLQTENSKVFFNRSEHPDEVTLKGEFALLEKDNMFALSDTLGNLITDYDYDFSLTLLIPGKIALGNGEYFTAFADYISGKYILGVADLTSDNNRDAVVSYNDGKYFFADFDTLEIKGDTYDEYIGSLYGSAVFKKDGIRFVTDSKGNIKYKGNENIYGAAFDKYIIEKNSKLGVINNEFEEIIPCEYDDINIIGDNVYILLKDGKYSLYNQNKILLDGFSYMECKYNYISADDGVYNFEGNLISKNEKYTYFLNKYGIIVYDEETKRAGKLISENSNPVVEIDGEILYSDTLSRIKNNITLIPLRAMAEETGFNTEYIEETKEIRLTKEDKEIVFKIGDKKAISNGAEITLNAAPEIINNRTLVPARAVSDAFGYDIEWDGERRLVEITTN